MSYFYTKSELVEIVYLKQHIAFTVYVQQHPHEKQALMTIRKLSILYNSSGSGSCTTHKL